MKTTTWLLFSTILLAASACGNAASPSGAGSAGAGNTGGGAGGSSAGGSGSGGSEGETVTFTMDTFKIPSGGEVYKCQNFANPFGGNDAEVRKFESHMTAGSHHLLMFYKSGVTDGPLEDCSGLEFAATPYSTQLPDDSLSFPEGVAALIKPTTGLRFQSHYLNTSDKELTATVTITLHLADPGTVTAHAGVLFVVQPEIDVPPASTKTITRDCQIPYDMNLIKAGSHMHKHGTKFTSTIGGAKVFDTTDWDEPEPALFDPPMAVKGGDPLSFACTFVNNSADTLTFGESAESNEMCIFVSSFYPVPNDGVVTTTCF